MIDFSARLRRSEQPFVHFVGDDVVHRASLARLRGEVPPDSRFTRVAASGLSARREYRFSVLNLVEDSRPCIDESSLGASWRQLLADLRSPDIHAWFLRETELDVSKCQQSIGLFLHTDGDFQGVSTGKIGKVLGASFYLGDLWPEDAGGAFELRTNNGQQVVGEVMPQAGRCLAFQPTTGSWHATQPITPGRGLRRLFITMQYFPRAPEPQ